MLLQSLGSPRGDGALLQLQLFVSSHDLRSTRHREAVRQLSNTMQGGGPRAHTASEQAETSGLDVVVAVCGACFTSAIRQTCCSSLATRRRSFSSAGAAASAGWRQQSQRNFRYRRPKGPTPCGADVPSSRFSNRRFTEATSSSAAGSPGR